MAQWSHESRSDFRDQTVFTVYPNRIWVGKRGNPYHSAEWSWKPEDEWPLTPMPETRGYYRHSDKSLHFYARPSAYDVLRVKKHLAMRGLTVKILDGSLYDRLEKRYAKRDFSRMRSEGVVTRGELIESIVATLVRPLQESVSVRVVPPKELNDRVWDKHGGSGVVALAKHWRKKKGFSSNEEMNISQGNWLQLRPILGFTPGFGNVNVGRIRNEDLPRFLRRIVVLLNDSRAKTAKIPAQEIRIPKRRVDSSGMTHIGSKYSYYGEFDPVRYLKYLHKYALIAYKRGGDLVFS